MPVFRGMSAKSANEYRSGSPDAYGKIAERKVSDGDAPCRCCLRHITKGDEMLVLAHRPFSELQPYAETGPIFLCAEHCEQSDISRVPNILTSPEYLLKGYSADERIVYGTGQITPVEQIASYADAILARKNVVFVDLRSAKNNCWQARITAN